MNVEAFNNIVLALFETAVAMSAIIAILLLLTPLLGRRYAAKWRYFIWIAVALRLMLPLNFTLPKAAVIEAPRIEVPYAVTGAMRPEAPETSSGGGSANVSREPEGFDREYSRDERAARDEPQSAAKAIPLHELLSLVWLGGAAAAAIWRALAFGWWRRRVRRCSAPADAREQALFDELRAQLGISRHVRLLRCAAASGPLSTGIFRPAVLLPETTCFDEAALGHILRHELTHIKRRDLLYKLLFTAVCTLHWWNPLVWMMAREASLDAELACDDEATSGFDRTLRAGYAETLLECAGRPRPAEAAFTTHFRSGTKALKRRLGNLFGRCARRRGVLLLCVVTVAAAVSAGFIACGIKDKTDGSKALLRRIEKASGARVESGIYADFDGDGKNEAFAVTDVGELWYASPDGCSRPEWDGMTADVTEYDYGAPELLELKRPAARVELGGENGRTLLFGASAGGAYELTDYPHVRSLTGNGGEFTGLDAGGRPYWFHYDYDRGAFYEYGAREIETERLLALENGKELLASLPKGAEIAGILYRENGIFNINYTAGGEKRHMTLRLEGWTLSDATREYGSAAPGEGEYALWLSERLARVPSEYDPVLRLGDRAYPEWFRFTETPVEDWSTYYTGPVRLDCGYSAQHVNWLRATKLLEGLELTFAGGGAEKTPLGCAPFELTVKYYDKSAVYRFEDGTVTYFDERTPEGQRCSVGNPDAMRKFMEYSTIVNPDAATLGEAEKLTREDVVSVEYSVFNPGGSENICTLSGAAADRAIEMLLGQFVRPVREGENISTGGGKTYRLTLGDGSVREFSDAGVIFVNGERRYAGFDWDGQGELDYELRSRADGSIETLGSWDCRTWRIYLRGAEPGLSETLSISGKDGYTPLTRDVSAERLESAAALRAFRERYSKLLPAADDEAFGYERKEFDQYTASLDREFFDGFVLWALVFGGGEDRVAVLRSSIVRFEDRIRLSVEEHITDYGNPDGERTLMLLAVPREYAGLPVEPFVVYNDDQSGWVNYSGRIMTLEDVRGFAERAANGERIAWDELDEYRGRILGAEVYKVRYDVESDGTERYLIAERDVFDGSGGYVAAMTFRDGKAVYDVLSGEAP